MYTPLINNRTRAGFTLIEVMSAIAILSLVMAAASMTYMMSIRTWRLNAARIAANSAASQALTRCTMGVGSGFGLRAAFLPVLISTDYNGWQIRFTTPLGESGDATADNKLTYSSNTGTITYQSDNAQPTVIGKNIIASTVSRQSDAIVLTVRAQADKGYTNITSQLTTSINPRNRI